MKDIVVSGDIVSSLVALLVAGIGGFSLIMVAIVKTFFHARAANSAVNNTKHEGLMEMVVGLHEHKGTIVEKVDAIHEKVDRLITDQVDHKVVHERIEGEQLKANKWIERLAEECDQRKD